MTLHTNLLSDRGADELVPSRYALKIGEIDVLVISDGMLPLSPQLWAHNAEPGVLDDWLDNQFLPRDVADWPLNVLVIRSGDQTILVDAGAGSDPNLKLEKSGRLARRLEAAGIELSSVTDVVLTHMHLDHIGGLVADGMRDRLRPDLRIHVAAAEVKFWESPDFSRTAMPAGFPDAHRATAKRFMEQYGNLVHTFEEEHEVAPGVIARVTGGHTPGHSLVRIASGGERLTFVGDLIFQVGFDRPDWQNGFEHDPEESARVRVKLLQEFAASREPFLGAHLPFPSVYHVSVAGGVFRAVPTVWDY